MKPLIEPEGDRVEREKLRVLFTVALRCAPAHIKRSYVSKLAQDRDRAVEELADLMLRQVDHETRGVFDWSPQPGNLFPSLDGRNEKR